MDTSINQVVEKRNVSSYVLFAIFWRRTGRSLCSRWTEAIFFDLSVGRLAISCSPRAPLSFSHGEHLRIRPLTSEFILMTWYPWFLISFSVIPFPSYETASWQKRMIGLTQANILGGRQDSSDPFQCLDSLSVHLLSEVRFRHCSNSDCVADGPWVNPVFFLLPEFLSLDQTLLSVLSRRF